jgi:zinc protease
VHVAARPSRAAGWFTSYLACAPDKEEQARRGLLREWAALADAPVSDDELSRAKAYVLGAHAIRQQSAAAVASEIADAWLADALPTYDTESTVIAAVTAADVQRVARSAVSAAPVWGAVRGVSVAG